MGGGGVVHGDAKASVGGGLGGSGERELGSHGGALGGASEGAMAAVTVPSEWGGAHSLIARLINITGSARVR